VRGLTKTGLGACIISILSSLVLLSGCAQLGESKQQAVEHFIDTMVATHHVDKAELEALFTQVVVQDSVLQKIRKPAEAMPWYVYRTKLITDERIAEGVKFWSQHQDVLRRVEQDYGVPAQIIVAIIGVETSYGKYTGRYRVLDALATLAFHYPPRSAFFTKELEAFLLLSRAENMPPLDSKGSYAGAMGLGQFMPSSFIHYAVDFDHDGKKDIWHNSSDAIASIANYFVQHHWQVGQPIAMPVTVLGQQYKRIMNDQLKPDLRPSALESLDLKIIGAIDPDKKVKILEFKQQDGVEVWVGLDNFYCLTRYNHSPLYAMAVYQLSQIIVKKMIFNEE